jgi:predicted nucleotide-binding protein
MAPTRATGPATAREPVLLVPRSVAAAQLDQQIDKGVQLRATPQAESRAHRDQFEDWTDETIELLRHIFDSEVEAKRFCATSRDPKARLLALDYFWNSQEEFFAPLDARITALRHLEDRLRFIPEAPRIDVTIPPEAPLARDAARAPDPGGTRAAIAAAPIAVAPGEGRVVVVHGHDTAARAQVHALLLNLGMEPIVIDGPITTADQIERDAAGAAFAVVLLSPDDIGGPRRVPAESLRPRPRQDLLLELGFFCGQLGHRRVCGLYGDEIEIPSAFPGVIWIRLDRDGAWRNRLLHEMQAAGLDVDGPGHA